MRASPDYSSERVANGAGRWIARRMSAAFAAFSAASLALITVRSSRFRSSVGKDDKVGFCLKMV